MFARHVHDEMDLGNTFLSVLLDRIQIINATRRVLLIYIMTIPLWYSKFIMASSLTLKVYYEEAYHRFSSHFMFLESTVQCILL